MSTTTMAKPVQTSKTGQTQPPPAYFMSLTVENFRCFRAEQTLDLSDGNGRPAPWTIILGDNGVGKTTLLQCLAALQPNRFGFPNDDILSPIIVYRPEHSILAELINQGKMQKVMMKFATSIYYGARLSGKNIGQRVEEFVFRFDAERNKPGFLFSAIKQDEANVEGLICYGYSATRRMGTGSLAERKVTDPRDSLFSDDAPLINAEEWLLQADYAASKPSNSQKRWERRRDHIKEILVNLLPDVQDIQFGSADEDGALPTVEVKTPYGWVPMQSLSLGYKTLISWMVDLASHLFDRYPDSPNPLAEPAVVLVDEIDLHLHPKWQRTLVNYLFNIFPNTQFIATAHSPLVVQAASGANIVVLRREGDHVVIDNDVEAVKGWRVDQVLTSDLFGLESARPPELDGLLAERTQILSKARLADGDRKRLKTLETEIGSLPTGETPSDMEAMDVIRRAAKLLKDGKAE